MFKKILSAFIGSFVAIWVSAILLFVTFIVVIVSLVSDSGPAAVDKHSVLYLNLKGEVAERFQGVDVKSMILDSGDMPQFLDEILESVELAADDEHIDGIYLDCEGAEMGYASRQELIQALAKFKKDSGKWVLAYGDNYSQGDYYVATMADTVAVNPAGNVDVRGLAAQIPFFKDALDKLGVTVQVVKVGQFKSAVEPYILNAPSEASKLQTEVYMGAIWQSMVNTIAQNRKVTAAAVNTWADSMLVTKKAQGLVKDSVVDLVCYRRTIEEKIRQRTETDAKDDLPLVTPREYMASDGPDRVAKLRDSKKDKAKDKDGHFAIYYAVGDIVDDGSDGIVGPDVVKDIDKLTNDDDVKGLILRVNSGGGSAFASEQIWEALENFKKTGRPFYVSMGDVAASGGYYISCGADSIFCDPTTITGSIGIFGLIPCFKGLGDKVGVNMATIETNPNADLMSVFNPMTAEQRAAMQGYVEQGYALFTKRVSDGRGLPLAKVLEIAEGRVWDGTAAKQIGLVDVMGGIDAVTAAMGKRLGMSKYNYKTYQQAELSAFEEMLLSSTGSAAVKTAGEAAEAVDPTGGALRGRAARTISRNVELVRNAPATGTVQARMEPVTLE